MTTYIHNERGASTPIIVILVLLAVVIIFAATQLAPLSWDHANFEQALQTAMVSSMVPPYDNVEETVRQKIRSLLNDMGAQYQDEHIKVEVTENNERINVEVWYSRIHSLPFYQNPKQFYVNLSHKSLLPKKINIPERSPLPKLD